MESNNDETAKPFDAAHGYAVRVKLFAAFALTALWSLYKPSETKQMIDDWVAADRKRARAKFMARMFNRPHTAQPSGAARKEQDHGN